MLVPQETEEDRRDTSIRMFTHALGGYVDKGLKSEYVDQICLWIHRVNSGIEPLIKTPNTCWDLVVLVTKDIAPNLFKDNLPKDCYEQLLKVLKHYPEWLIEKELQELIVKHESRKMHDVLKWMRSNQKVTEFRISFLRSDYFIIHPLAQDGDTLDVDLKYKDDSLRHIIIPPENVRSEPIKKKKSKR